MEKNNLKVTVIGGGSTYTPELVSGFLERASTLPVSELCLMDIDEERLKVVGGFAERMVKARGAPFQVTLMTDQREALRSASYVVTQLRVGGMDARRKDEYLGKRHGLIGQETTGVGGMAKALRTIPVVLKIAKEMREVAPDALLVNFTNPSGLITEALFRYAPGVQAVGVCNIPITTKMAILEEIESSLDTDISPERAQLDTLGLNHLSWHRGFQVNGQNIWPLVIERFLSGLRSSDDPEWPPHLIDALKMIPNYYLKYYYQTDRALAAQSGWPPSRAEEVLTIESDLLAQYADPALTQPPEDLLKRGGAYYSTLATQLLNAHYNDLGERHILNVLQAGAVADWPADWVLEMPCRVDKSGIHPIPTEPLPLVCYGLLATVKAYEILTVEAAVHGDRQAPYQALLVHPLGPSADQVPTVLEDLLETHRDYLPLLG